MTYPDSVEYLYALGNESKSLKLGLGPITKLLAALANPQKSFPSIHVAGTNGKGSTCAMIEAGLRAAGIRTGLFTSPHLVEPTERIQINGIPATSEEFLSAFHQVHAAAEELLASGELEYHPSYFETVTAMAFLLFRARKIDLAVVEVGLGGRLDATNVLQPEICVITAIDFDHEAILGGSLELIAAEKAGILKAGTKAVFSRQRPEADQVIRNRAAQLAIPVTSTGEGPLPIRCPLAGEHQIQNALTAVAVLQLLGIGPAGIEQTKWPGRLELVARRPDILLDGAHNPAGARALAAYIRQIKSSRCVWMIYGAMRDKSVQEITEILFPVADKVILTAATSSRAVRPHALLPSVQHAAVQVAPDVAAALAIARTAPVDDLVVVAGSLYVVGEARALLVK
ncbi:MAG TPA: folylpolyglutamate synthase/dihydrofolate synthase family protein [Bryobacteraceae bacterium]|nr:folylpolyglutamate synthase/dihydrofolate synthase family protein [Bryobacteraceae bacterium]